MLIYLKKIYILINKLRLWILCNVEFKEKQYLHYFEIKFYNEKPIKDIIFSKDKSFMNTLLRVWNASATTIKEGEKLY